MRVERGTALAGFAFVAATVGNVATESAGPDITKSAADVAAKLASDRALVQINSLLHIAGGIAVLVFAAGLASLIVARGGGTALARTVSGSGVLTGAAMILTAVLATTAASSIHQLGDSQAAYALYRGAATSSIISMGFFAISLAAGVIALPETGMLSRAWVRAGLPVASVLLVGAFNFLAPDDGPLYPVMILGGVLSLVYVAALSAALFGAAQSRGALHPSLSPETAVN